MISLNPDDPQRVNLRDPDEDSVLVEAVSLAPGLEKEDATRYVYVSSPGAYVRVSELLYALARVNPHALSLDTWIELFDHFGVHGTTPELAEGAPYDDNSTTIWDTGDMIGPCPGDGFAAYTIAVEPPRVNPRIAEIESEIAKLTAEKESLL